MGTNDEERGFKVVDRRSFDADGRAREPEIQGSAPREEQEEGKGAARPAAGQREQDRGGECTEPSAATLPDVDFVTFILSLYNSAACHLGHALNPETNRCEKNLPLAKQTIDILAMLQEKTQGNLSGEEERIVAEILYDLRLAYVQASER